MAEVINEIKIDKKTIYAVAHNMSKSAKAAGLIYTPDDKLGFSRKHNEKAFSYFAGIKKIKEDNCSPNKKFKHSPVQGIRCGFAK